MENLIRNVIFIGAIVFLIVMLLPNHPSFGDILEFIMPLGIPIFIFLLFIFQIKTQLKKKGGSPKTLQDIIKHIEEQSRSYGQKK